MAATDETTWGNLLERPKRVIICTGAARSGKSSSAIELYRRCQDELGRPGCLVILPSAPAVAAFRDQLLALTPSGVLLAPAVMSFAALAGRVMQQAGQKAVVLDALGRRLLLDEVVSSLARQGRLKKLGRLADTPGLSAALDESIAELKRAAVEPEALAAAINPRSEKDQDLLAVYRLYQQRLHETGRYDSEGLLWQARNCLRDQGGGGLGIAGFSAVAVDGFIDFTPTQLEILSLLSGSLQRMLITLPWQAGPARGRLWQWTQRTLDRLRQAMPQAAVVAMGDQADPMPGLFDLSQRQPVAAATNPAAVEIEVVDCADLAAEVRAVTRAVKADLLSGVGAGQVAVLARGLEGYREEIARVFEEFQVPLADWSRPLNSSGAVRFVLRLLGLGRRYESADVLAVIGNSYFLPSRLGDFTPDDAATAGLAIRAANVAGGRESYQTAFERLIRRAKKALELGEEGLPGLAADESQLARAAALLEALFNRLDRLAGATEAGQYVTDLLALMDEWGLAEAVGTLDEPALLAREWRALDSLRGLLSVLAGTTWPGDAAAWPERIAQLAAVATIEPARQESLVAVLDVLDARAVRFERVYLLGLNEHVFPQLGSERCFIDESDRAAWAGRGVVLDRRRDLIGREMLLFYLAATRGERKLTVTYQSSQGSGSASMFLEDLLAAANLGGNKVKRWAIGPARFVWPAGQIASRRELLHAAFATFDDSAPAEGAQGPALLAAAAAEVPAAVHSACHGLLSASRRWRKAPMDCFDGVLDEPALLEALAKRFPAGHVFSASELNTFAQCPWEFFARYLLGLRPLDEVQANLTPVQRGTFCHAVLYGVMTTLRDRQGGPVNLAGLSETEVDALLEQAVSAQRERLADQALYSRLWELQTRSWQRMLRTYLLSEVGRAKADGNRPALFELAFGLRPAQAGRCDPASTSEAVTIKLGSFDVRLHGKIDRVDFVGPEDLPEAIDYKTGALPSAKDLAAGRELQLALYSAALEQLLKKPCQGGVYHDVEELKKLYLTRDKVSGRNATYEQAMATALEAAGRYIQAMAAGRFALAPAKGCAKYCPYRRVCQYSQARAARKGEAVEGEDDAA